MPELTNVQNDASVTRIVPGSDQMIFLYQGKIGQLFLEPLDFVKLSGARSHNVTMFRDRLASFYHGRLNGRWKNIEATLEGQRQLLSEHSHVTALHCAGTSQGGYAAILFGHHLKARTVHAFAPQTEIISLVTPASLKFFPEPHQDLSRLLSEHNGITEYHLYYAEGNDIDTAHANRIAHCPGVSLHPLPGSSHSPFTHVEPADVLAGLFPESKREDSKP
ncbi:MAG: hypothetical protein AAGI11_10750 [Pseudomonadota bacterium]